MPSLEGKILATLVVVSVNVAVLVLLGWFVLLSAVPSALLLATLLVR